MTKIISILLVAALNCSLCCGQVKGTGKDVVVDGTSNESFRKSLASIKASLSEADRKVLDDALEFIREHDIKEYDTVKALRRQFEAVTKGENVVIDSLTELRSRFHGKTAAEIVDTAEYVLRNERWAAVQRFEKAMDETIADLTNAKRIKAWEKQLLGSIRVLQPTLSRKEGEKHNAIEFYLENQSEIAISRVTVKASYVDLKLGKQLAVKVLVGCSPGGISQNIEPHKRASILQKIQSFEISETKPNIWNVALHPDAVLIIEVLEIQDENWDTIAGSTFSEEERQEDLEVAKMQKYMPKLIDYRKRGKSFEENLALIQRPLFEVLTSKHLFKDALRGDSKGLHEKFDSMIQPENLSDFEALINNAQPLWKVRKMYQQFEWKRRASEQTSPAR